METFRIAIVGTGGIAATHARNLAPLGGRAQLVAAADIDAGRLEDFCHRWKIPGRYHDLGALLAAERPDLVHLCTPPGLHKEQAAECLTAGVNVLCEKPPALSLADMDEIAAAEAAGGAHFATVFQQRFGSAAERLRGALASGALGRPLVAVCNTLWYRADDYFAVPWRGKWEVEGGGPTMGHGIHQFDLLLSVLGQWREVTAVAARQARPTDTEDLSCAIATFEGGAIATVTNSLLSPRETTYLRFDFEHATVEVEHLYGYEDDSWTVTPLPGREDEVRAAWAAGPAGRACGHGVQFAAVLDALEADDAPPVTLRQARDTLEFAAATYASAFGRRPVRRGEIGTGHPFHHRMNGDGAPWSGTPVPAPAPAPASAPGADGLGLLPDDVTSLRITAHGRELTRYVHRPWDGQLESPRPYFHPLHTLGGDRVSLYRPHDHVWHKGIAWSLPNVETENFWGGPTYRRGVGYAQYDNDGSMDHEAYEHVSLRDGVVRVAERLRWHTQGGAAWFTEQRRFAVTLLPGDADAWALVFESVMTNVRGRPTVIGSPTTEGRENAGYGGLFWRGPRSFTGGRVHTPDASGGDELMGVRAPWLAFTGSHDDHGRASTLAFVDAPGNDARNPQLPTKWFVRSTPFACVCPAPFFDEEITVGDGERLTRRYAVVIADGDRGRSGVEKLAQAGGEALGLLGHKWQQEWQQEWRMPGEQR
ncbi:PmoA family protein [Streptomyces sp. RB6PN25]|uniref:PmoA family protein n=1 Tax=Streptomyces humicola TaxID=2953240 RepID=A0ABT1PPN0_9ACTN|nr:DUF6807 family protein [Streptomyces humicola]MCQ4079636.1 PmoA family protein [Streptomyces humicola]